MKCLLCNKKMKRLGNHVNTDTPLTKIEYTFSCDGCKIIVDVTANLSNRFHEKVNEIYEKGE